MPRDQNCQYKFRVATKLNPFALITKQIGVFCLWQICGNDCCLRIKGVNDNSQWRLDLYTFHWRQATVLTYAGHAERPKSIDHSGFINGSNYYGFQPIQFCSWCTSSAGLIISFNLRLKEHTPASTPDKYWISSCVNHSRLNLIEFYLSMIFQACGKSSFAPADVFILWTHGRRWRISGSTASKINRKSNKCWHIFSANQPKCHQRRMTLSLNRCVSRYLYHVSTRDNFLLR